MEHVNSVAYLGGPFFVAIVKKLENMVWPIFCVSISGQKKFGPPPL